MHILEMECHMIPPKYGQNKVYRGQKKITSLPVSVTVPSGVSEESILRTKVILFSELELPPHFPKIQPGNFKSKI